MVLFTIYHFCISILDLWFSIHVSSITREHKKKKKMFRFFYLFKIFIINWSWFLKNILLIICEEPVLTYFHHSKQTTSICFKLSPCSKCLFKVMIWFSVYAWTTFQATCGGNETAIYCQPISSHRRNRQKSLHIA